MTIIKRSAFDVVSDMRAGKARYFQYTDGCAECDTRANTSDQQPEPSTCNACGIATYVEKPLEHTSRTATNRIGTLPLFQAITS